VVKGSRRGAITTNYVYLDDGRSATLPARVDGRQSDHNAPNSSAGKFFLLLSAIHRPEARIVAAGANLDAGSPAARGTEPEDLLRAVPSDSYSVCLTEQFTGRFASNFM
jgi:hypothetical protein